MRKARPRGCTGRAGQAKDPTAPAWFGMHCGLWMRNARWRALAFSRPLTWAAPTPDESVLTLWIEPAIVMEGTLTSKF